MRKHICVEDTVCRCNAGATNPADGCPIHGLSGRSRCKHCGKFMIVWEKCMKKIIERNINRAVKDMAREIDKQVLASLEVK